MTSYTLPDDLRDQVRFNEAGLVPAVAQDAGSGEVLMLAWMNEEALAATLATGQGVYWSRSRQELWRKGATSGHTQQVKNIKLDCDGDTVLLSVEQIGPACHTGTETCFTGRDIAFTPRQDEGSSAEEPQGGSSAASRRGEPNA